MRYDTSGQLAFSPSDLVLAMRSQFASWMERFALEESGLAETIPQDEDLMMALLAAKGNDHEKAFLQALQDRHGVGSVGVVNGPTTQLRTQQTLAFMRDGIPFIYQAQLQRGQFSGSADFLVRVKGQSNFGAWHYEAWDTKLSQTTKHYFVVQLCCYSWMLEAMQGVRPDEAVIVLGNLSEERFRVARYYDYFVRVKQEFLDAQANFIADIGTAPDPALDTDYGRWTTYANQLMEESDSLALVAGIRKSQAKKLASAGITTLSGLAATQEVNVKGMPQDTLAKLKAQAAIQQASKGLDIPLFTVLADDGGKGLSALPPASALDAYFDIEGHPLLEGGLEYLWGVSYLCPDAPLGKHYAYKDWWAHTPEQEKEALEGFVDWAYGRWQQDQTMHIYHYANYEVAALKRLSVRHGTRIKEVAELLANNVLVDLYRLVLNGLLIGDRSYSIKKVERLYRGKRTTDVANGGESVIVYETWRQQGGVKQWEETGYVGWKSSPDTMDWGMFPILKGIRDYNIDDCESTLELVGWLRGQQRLYGIDYAPKTNETKPDKELTERQLNNAERKQELRDWIQRLLARYEGDPHLQEDPRAQLMVALLGFHDRERKPKIWTYFERLTKSGAELYDDDSTLQGITVTGTCQADGGIRVTGQYDPKQPVRKDKFVTGTLHGTDKKFKYIEFGGAEAQGEVSFTVEASSEVGLNDSTITLLADEPFINSDTLEKRLCQACENLFDNQLAPQANAVLLRSEPVFVSDGQYLPVNRQRYPDDGEYLTAIINAVKAMDNCCLAIQGPPGAGKTFTASHVIQALVVDGKRVGVMSTSHAAIGNLLDAYYKLSAHGRVAKIGGLGTNQDTFREKYPEDKYPAYHYRPQMKFTGKEPYVSFPVVGGTAYAFASEIAFGDPLDYLVVDEASQVPLANLMAVAGSAHNIILLGDQNQLEQPIQGAHPGFSGMSALEYVLGHHGVVQENQGIFLETTYRMHPDVCLPLSDIVYEGKLKAAVNNSRQKIHVENGRWVKQTEGIMVVNVSHDGNRQASEEEAEVIDRLIGELKTGAYSDKNGNLHQVTDQDILIVAPYNMQVNLLKEHLPHTCPIGTIDKFQGQEAPVVIVSMAVSDVEESARGLDFVFDTNRLNVAVSRAKALAIIVANPGLEKCHVNSLAQMQKASFYSRLVNPQSGYEI